MGLGWSLTLDPSAYLLLGIALTILFQRFVRRAPLRALWVREATPIGLNWLGPAALLAIRPAYLLIGEFGRRHWAISGYLVAALVGAIAAGYALRHLRRETIQPFLMCQLTAGTIGVGMFVAVKSVAPDHHAPLLLVGLQDFLVIFPVCFVMEEVSFRGALDSHLHRPGEPFRLTSALLGSILWGVWHLPIVPTARSLADALGMVLGVAVVHSLIGVPLALCWRKSGNLAVPAFTHALIDAVRNGLRITG